MKLRREVLLTLTAGLVTLAVIVAPVFAEETFGVITHVAPESKKVSFLTKAGETIELEITDSTEIVDGKGEKVKSKGTKANGEAAGYTLEDVQDALSRVTAAGQKGIFARVTHEKAVASRLTVGFPREEKPKK